MSFGQSQEFVLLIVENNFVDVYLITIAGGFVGQQVFPDLKFGDNKQGGGEDQRYDQGEQRQQSGQANGHLL